MTAPRWLAALGVLVAGCGAPARSVRVADPAPTPAPVAAAAPRPRMPLPRLPAPAAAVRPPLPAAREATLGSGLRVVVIEHHRRPVLGVYLVLPGGSASDPHGSAGATRLALLLAGDLHERSATGEELVDEKSFRRQVADLGGAAALVTTADVSLIAFEGYPQDAKAYFQLLADALIHPRHGQESFTERRNQALDALEDVEAADPEALQRAIREAAFGPGQPYARSELGTVRDLSRLGLEDVMARQRELLVPGGATLLVVGDVQADPVLAEAATAFRRWVGSAPRPVQEAAPRPPQAGVTFIRRQPASTLMACAARDLGDVRAGDAELEVLSAVLGGGARSRLMMSLREQQGLTYTATAELVRYRRARAFLACAPLSGARAGQGVRLFRQTLENLRDGPPDEDELVRARALLQAERDAALEDADGLARLWVDALARGLRAPPIDAERDAVERVTAADVQRAARSVLRPGAVRWILSGDTVAAGSAASANGLGPLRQLVLGR